MTVPTAASPRLLALGTTRWTILVFEFDAWPAIVGTDYMDDVWDYDVSWGDGNFDGANSVPMTEIVLDGTVYPYFDGGANIDRTKARPGLRLEHQYADDGPHTVTLTSWAYHGFFGSSSGGPVACGTWERIVAAPPAVSAQPKLVVATGQLNEEFDPQDPWGWEPLLLLSASFPVPACASFTPGLGSFSSPGPIIGDGGYFDWEVRSVGGHGGMLISRDNYDGKSPADFAGIVETPDNASGLVGVSDAVHPDWTVQDDLTGVYQATADVEQYGSNEILLADVAAGVWDPTQQIEIPQMRRYSLSTGAVVASESALFPPAAVIQPTQGGQRFQITPRYPAGDGKCAYAAGVFNFLWEWDYVTGTLFPLFDVDTLLSTIPPPTGWTAGGLGPTKARRRADGGFLFLAGRTETSGSLSGSATYLVAVNPAGEIDGYARLGGSAFGSSIYEQMPNCFTENSDQASVSPFLCYDPVHGHAYVARFLDPYVANQKNATNGWNGPPWPGPPSWATRNWVKYVSVIYRFSAADPSSGPTVVGWLEHPSWWWQCFDVPAGPPLFGGIAHRWDYQIHTMGEGSVPGGSWAPRGNGPCGQPIYQRSYPRDDDLGAGDARSWPPPTSSQRGVRSLPTAVF